MVESKAHYHVFLSHNSRDKGAVEPLAVMLKEKGLNPFLDKWNLVPGEPIEDALIEALEHSDSAVIFVGPGGEGPWQSEEMRDILKRAVKSHNEFRAIPVLLPNASADALEKSFLGSRLWIEFKSVDDDDALLRMAKAIQGEASGDASFTLPAEPAPYRGLERFERIEKPEEDFFFGRDDEIRALVERLVQQRFVAVVGASGSGKSSLIRAGLTKQLAEDIHPGIRRWQTITVEPGSTPFRSLAVQVAVAAGIPVADREDWIEQRVEKWTAAPDGVRKDLEMRFAEAKEPLLVFIDQFEELFTHRREGQESEAIARNFVANLADIWRHGGDRVRVVVALRADFVDRCLEIGSLKELLQDRTMLVGEVGDDALREIVKEPAARVGAFLEKGLMERILTEVRSQSGSLPLLQQALHELWRHRKGAWLTHDAFDASGGVARALNDQAQGAYKSLNDAQKKIADSLFPRLITLGEGVADTRRRVKRNELYPEGVEPGAVNAVIDTLSGKDARILVTTREGGTAEDLGSGEDFVEFTHEALLANWDHLVTLLDSERESIRKHRSLTAAAEEWESKPEDEREKFLLRAGQLVIAEQWATDEGGYARLNQLERRFLDESIQERIAEEARKAKIARWLKMLTMAALIMASVAGWFWFDANKQKTIADENAAEATKQEKIAKEQATTAKLREQAALVKNLLPAEPLEGLLLAIQTTGQSQARLGNVLPQVQSSLLSAIQVAKETNRFKGFEGWISSVAISPDGKTIVTGSINEFVNGQELVGTLRLWDLEGNPIAGPKTGHVGEVYSVAFSPDGKTITSGGKDGTVRLWDLGGNPIPGPKTGHVGEVYSVAFSPDGKTIISGGKDGTVRLWDLGGNPIGAPLRGHDDAVTSVAFSPDGKTIISGGKDGTVRLWDLGGNPIGAPLRGHDDAVTSVAFSPDGKTIVSGSRDKTVRLWGIEGAEGSPIGGSFRGHADQVNAVTISRDGQMIVTGSDDGTVRRWDRKGNPIGEPLRGHDFYVTSVAISPDGKTIISGGSHYDTVRSWDLEDNPIRTPLNGHEGRVTSVTVSRDRHRVAVGGGDKTVRLWDQKGNLMGNAFNGYSPAVYAVAFSPDGQAIVTGSDDNTVRLWDRDGNPMGKPFNGHGHQAPIRSVAFSTAGKTIVSGSDDGTVRLWDLEGNSIGKPLTDNKDPVTLVGISPDGKTIMGRSVNMTVRWWDRNGNPMGKPFHATEHKASFLAFSPDGRYVVGSNVVGGKDRTVRLWDSQGNLIGKPFHGHQLSVNAVAFSPDGQLIVSGSMDKTVRLWDRKGNPMGKPFQGHSGLIYAVAFSPGGKYVASARSGELGMWRAGDLSTWLQVACERLRNHSVLAEPESDMAKDVSDICLKSGGWSAAEKARFLIKQGRALAREGNDKGSLEKFGRARELDSSLALPTEADIKRPAVSENLRR